ncbi:riboflavin transporter RibU, partial [Staphylococcus xylosus]
SGVIPFNIIKGVIISIVFILLYNRLKNVLPR